MLSVLFVLSLAAAPEAADPGASVPVEDAGAMTTARAVAPELAVGTATGLGLAVVAPNVEAAVILSPFLVVAWQTFQIREGFSHIAAVLTVIVGVLVAVPCALITVPLWEALGFSLGAGAARVGTRLAAGERDALGMAWKVVRPAVVALPAALLTGAALVLVAALIPAMFFVTNSVSLAQLGEMFPVVVVATGGVAGAAVLAVYLAGALTLRPALLFALERWDRLRD